MTILVIGALSLSGQCANTLCKELFAGAVYPLEAEIKNLTPINLALPEARLHLAPMACVKTTFPDFARLQRATSSLRQIAELNQMAAIVSISAGEQQPAELVEPVVQTADEAEPVAEQAPDEAPAAGVVTIVQDDEKDYVVELEGVRFTPNRNQVREDGTLTAGGVKLFEEAKAQAAATEESMQ